MQISEKVARLKSDFDGVYDRGYKSGMENSENYKAGYAEAKAITISIIDRSLTECVIPEGTTLIGPHAFTYCNNLARVSIPEGVEKIGASAFQGAVLTELVLPLSCKYIDTWGLNGMNKLQSIIFGDLTYMGPNSAANNAKCMLYDFTRCTTVPELNHTNAFTGINANAKILVPASLYYDWIAATNWAEYADYIVPDGLVASRGLDIDAQGNLVGRGTCTDSVIVVPEEVTSIAWGFLENDKTVDTLILPEKGIPMDGDIGTGSALRVIKNYYYMYSSFGLSSATELELISVIGSELINNYQFAGLPEGIKYDFSRCESVPVLGSLDFITVGKGTLIYVPLKLYDEWIEATNWSEIAEYIVVAR